MHGEIMVQFEVESGKMTMEGGGEIRKNQTMICAPIMADAVDQAIELTHIAKLKGADVVEIRLDHFTSFDPDSELEKLIRDCRLPTLFTYRPIWEGGKYDGDENSRFRVLQRAMELGADHIDIELKAAREFDSFRNGKKPENCKIVVSSHNFESTPSSEELSDLVARIQAAGADIVKFATTALDITDVARVFQITVHSQVPIIAIVMGERGLISRILCPKFGGYLTFGSIEAEKVSAPGQPTIDDLINLYNFRLIDSNTKVFGVVGNPVRLSRSPKLYNRAFKSDGVNGVYVPLLVDDVPKFFDAYSCPDFSGFSVGIPHKQAALACCDEVDPVAKSIGAVNCVVRRPNDGKLLAFNTDYFGAISAIEEGLLRGTECGGTDESPLSGKLFVVIGAGGAGKALAWGAKEKGARVVVANRTYDRARELADQVGGQALSLSDLNSYRPQRGGMILANATSIGMQPRIDETPISKEALRYYDLVFDAVYAPKITRLLREAGEVGAIIVTGIEMLITQAYEQYERFSGLPAPKKLFKEIMESN